MDHSAILYTESDVRYWQIQFENITTYHDFRLIMKELVEKHPDIDVRTYATEYWLYYPSNPVENVNLDNAIVREIEYDPLFGHEDVFTIQKCREINNEDNLEFFPGHDILIKKFWEFHPILHEYQYNVMLAYSRAAIEYNLTHPGLEQYPMPPPNKLNNGDLKRIKDGILKKLNIHRMPWNYGR